MPKKASNKRVVCGIMMPISKMKVGDLFYSESYWQGVLDFLCDAIRAAGCDPIVAWENDKSDIIHSKIIYNIQNLPLMIAVLVGDNPNVWLECGMRLWTQRPILFLVSDKATKIPFDISPVCCLRFPEDCHYDKLKILKKEIKGKIKQMLDPSYRSILSHFAIIQPTDDNPSVDTIEISRFMTETRNAINEIKSRLDTEDALYGMSRYDSQHYDLYRPVRSFSYGVPYGGDPVFLKNEISRKNPFESTGPTGPTGPTTV